MKKLHSVATQTFECRGLAMFPVGKMKPKTIAVSRIFNRKASPFLQVEVRFDGARKRLSSRSVIRASALEFADCLLMQMRREARSPTTHSQP